jgi:hypothetical protein
MKTAGNRITSSILSIPKDGSINNTAKIIYTNEAGPLLTQNIILLESLPKLT